MPKPSLIKLEFVHIPATHFGAFWMFCEEHPGIQFKHATPQATPERLKRSNGKNAEGTTGKCIVLAALKSHNRLTTPQLTKLVVEAGKSPKSVGNILFELKGKKQIKQTKEGSSITAAGIAFLRENCPNKAKE